MSGLPHQSINRCRRQPTLHTQPLPVLGREPRRDSLPEAQVATASAGAATAHGFLPSEWNAIAPRVSSRGADETNGLRNANNSTPASASPPRRQYPGAPSSEESGPRCGSSYGPPPRYIAAALGTFPEVLPQCSPGAVSVSESKSSALMPESRVPVGVRRLVGAAEGSASGSRNAYLAR